MSVVSTMAVRVVSATGEVRKGIAELVAGKKRSVWVRFEDPIQVPYPEPGYSYLSSGEEFYLNDHGQAILVWGQGNEGPNPAWSLHPEDAHRVSERLETYR